MQGNIFSNFDDYNFPRPQIIRQDINKPAFRKKNFLFDAIVCDPPYGWRAGVRKTGLSDTKKEKREKRLEQKRKNKKDNDDTKDNENKIEDEKNKNEIITAENEDMDYNYVFVNGEKNMFLPTSHTTVNDIFDGLISFALDNLKVGGFLVCLFPVRKEKEEEDLVNHPINFPMHPQFKLIHACENINSRLRSRWCLTYKKIS